jgi:hypothetical protein
MYSYILFKKNSIYSSILFKKFNILLHTLIYSSKNSIYSYILFKNSVYSYILFKKFKTNHNQKGKGWAFTDFMVDCVEKMTEPQEREDEKDRAGNGPLASISTARKLPRKRQPGKGPFDLLQSGLQTLLQWGPFSLTVGCLRATVFQL